MPRRSKLETDFEHLDAFIGISCHLRDYRLVYNINKALGLALEKAEDLPVFNPRTQGLSEYSCYTYTDSDTLRTYFLLANSGNEGLMIPQLKQADYFLLIRIAGGGEIEDMLVEKIKNMQNVLTAFAIDQAKTANVDTLIFDLELHEMNLKKISSEKRGEKEDTDNL